MSQTRRWLAARYLLALGLVLAGSCLLTACGNEGGASPAAPTVDATTTAASEVIARALGTPLLQGDHVATAVAATLTASAPTVSPTATATPAPPTPDATRIAAVIGTQVATEFRATLTAAAAAATPIVAHTPVPTTPATPTAAPTRTATDTPTPIPTTPAPPTPELTRTAAAVATQLAGEARATMAAEATNTARAQATATADVRASGTAIAQTKATATTLAAAIGTQVAAELRATLTVEAKQTERAQTASTPILLPTESSTLTAITTAPITVWSSTAITPVTNFVTSTVQQPSGGLADIEIGQYGSLTVGVGEAITYTIIVTNNGPAAANDVWVVNALPEGISFIRLMSSQGICSGPTCALGPLALHGTVTITVVGMVSRSVAERTELVKATWVDSASIDPLRGNNFTYSTTFVNSTGQGAAAVAVNLETDATPTPMSTESVAVMAGQVFTDHHATLPAETVQPEQALASLTTATPRPSEMSTSLPTVTLSSVPTSLPSPTHTLDPTLRPFSSTITAAAPTSFTNTGANLRQGPGTGYPVIASYPANTPIEIKGKSAAGDWLNVSAPGGLSGWMAAKLVDTPAENSTVTTIAPPISAIETAVKAPTSSGRPVPYIPVISRGYAHQFWQNVRKGSEQAAITYNVQTSFEAPEYESQVDRQVEILRTALTKNPAAICIAALNSKSLIPLLEEALARDIPVIGFGFGVDSDIPVTTVATDEVAAAATAADKMAEFIGGEGEIAIIVHDQISRSGIDRVKGFTDRISARYPNIRIVRTDFSAGDPQQSAQLAKATLQANPNLKGYFGANEGSVVGILDAVTELGLEGRLVIIGYDSGKQQTDAIRSGLQAGAITQNPVGIGYKCVEAAVKALAGEDLPTFIDAGHYWYDKNNIDSDRIKVLLYE